MLRLVLFSPSDLRNVILWPVVECSSRLAAPLMPFRPLQGLLSGIADYAAGTNTLLGSRIISDEERAYLQLIENADSLNEYQQAAERLDELQSHNEWKRAPTSCEPEYDPKIVEAHMLALSRARMTSDLSAMQFLLRTTLSRDLGGMNTPSLYKHSWGGTKFLIEDYITNVLDTIEKFAESAVEFRLATSEVEFYQQSLEDALKYFGRSALTLSGGAIFGMKHIGVVKTLWEADVLPEIISGASAGSIIAAIIGVSNDEEMKRTLEEFPTTDLACFDPPGTTSLGWLWQRLRTLYRRGSFFSMDRMEVVLKGWLGDMTFQEAYYKTQRVLNICVSSADSGEPRILNYVTAPDVLIWSAVCASCSVPSAFPCASIFEKDPNTKQPRLWMQHAKQLFVDGSLDHDIPMRKLSEMFNVNFFIVSQVNPHVRLFLDPEERFHGHPVHSQWSSAWRIQQLARTIKHSLRREILQRAQQITDTGLIGDCLRWASVLSQQYTGDINIFPDIQPGEYAHMMANPTPEFIVRATAEGARAAWPKIHRIKNCVAIEIALIRAIYTLRERVNFGPEARAARELSQRAGRAGRGRSYSIRGQRPGFLRRRSLSNEHNNAVIEALPASISPSQDSMQLRRNRSLGALSDRLTLSTVTISPEITPSLSSQPMTDPLNNGEFSDLVRVTSYFSSVREKPADGQTAEVSGRVLHAS